MSTYGSVVWEWTYLSTYVIALHAKWAKLFVYRSLPKKGTWAEHLISLPKRGVGALSTVPHLTKKERPHHVYNNSKPSKQIIAHKITYNGITSGFKVESWRHTTIRMARQTLTQMWSPVLFHFTVMLGWLTEGRHMWGWCLNAILRIDLSVPNKKGCVAEALEANWGGYS